MLAPVHISIDGKRRISRIVYFQQLDLMLGGKIAYIRILRIRKTKYQGYLVRSLIIIP